MQSIVVVYSVGRSVAVSQSSCARNDIGNKTNGISYDSIFDRLPFFVAEPDRIPRTVTVLSDRIVFLRQRILREPPSPIGIVHARPEIDIGKTQKCLLLLAAEPMTVVGNRSRNRNPSFAERVVIVLFDHRTVGGDNLPHAAQMIRQEIARFQTLRRDYEPSPAERGAFETPVVVYQRTCIFDRIAFVESTYSDLCSVGEMGLIQVKLHLAS